MRATVEIAELGRVRLAATSRRATAHCEGKASPDSEPRGDRRDRGQLDRPVGVDEPERKGSPGEDDRGEEDGIEQDQEHEQSLRRGPRAQASLSQRPQRQREAAGAGRRQQPGRGRTCERDLSALAHAHPGRGAPGDQRQQPHVAGQRDALEDQRDHRPARAHVEHSPHSVGERMGAALGEQQRGHSSDRKQRRQGRAPRERADVQRRQRDLGDGGVGRDGVV